jgi:(p)ppGpp synthase/HD superfamily hydrolase
MSTHQRAIEIATEAHRGQLDKAGRDYIGHPLRVMEMGKTEEEKIVGVLHDVVEDTGWTFEKLAAEGFSQEVIAALRCVTKLHENEKYDDFIERVQKNPLATAVKINDLNHNLKRGRAGGHWHHVAKHEKALAFIQEFIEKQKHDEQ